MTAQTALRRLSFRRFMWLLFCCLMGVLWISAICDVKTEPAEYASLWGGEGPVAGLWYYASESVYLLHLAGLVIWFLAGILLCLSRGRFRRNLLLAHFGLSALWAAVNITV